MYLILKKIYYLLTRKERKQFVFLSLAIIVMAIIEAAGVASIMPFMAVVGNPKVIESNKWINWFYNAGGFTSSDRFLVFLGFLVLSVIVFSNLFKALIMWFEMRLTNYFGFNLSVRLLHGYLSQSYEYYIKNSTSLMEVMILQEISRFMHSSLQPIVSICSNIIVIFFILLLLIFVDPKLSAIIIVTLGFSYGILFSLIQKSIKKYGDVRFVANAKRSKVVKDVLSGVKELKVLGRELYFYKIFSKHAHLMAQGTVFHQTVSAMPRYIMEIISFGGVVVILLYFMIAKKDLNAVLPFLALYAFAGYRIMPLMQGVYSSLTNIRFNLPSVDAAYETQKENESVSGSSQWDSERPRKIPFENEIQLKGVFYTYPGAEDSSLNAVDLIIDKNSKVGFVGASGSGKTTIVDIILGLLVPQHGCLMVDNVLVTTDNIRSWQQNIGYVPQFIFLCDDTLASNIAFGLPPEEISIEAVEEAARLANLHDFVINELPHGYETIIGENGVRLSGGQRQRIGIARALYHDPEVLIMDEATSALDGITEEAVMLAIRSLGGKKTIITVAHRLTTVQDCDVVYLMEKGKVVEQGTYAELSNSSLKFKAMARSGA